MPTESQKRPLILIVDDTATNLSILSGPLAGAGYSIAVATDGEAALKQIQHELPELILLDVLMPGMGGFDVCKRLKESPVTRDIPVIFMTASTEITQRVRGLHLGAVDYITKPYLLEEILARVQVHVELRILTRTLAERNMLLEKEINERAAADAALEQLNQTLEQRVEERTAELSRTLDELKRTQAENARLFANVQKVSEELKRANEGLEREVAQRTAELLQAKDRLETELAERKRSEEARTALQREIIEAQNVRLAELSTPLIPITDDIMVMPLIGKMDEKRTEQVLETALSGVASRQVRVVIIDVTGVKLVDRGVAGTLVRVAGALRLLGANTVITGIRAEVARTLVELDLNLRDVVTMGTLQSGISYALRGQMR
jgi:CheY-like chemotaxis protein/anti-anti-sigma regulatory factor